jgi:antitoxin component YwqK of YwqJK toxin-antitoxin module
MRVLIAIIVLFLGSFASNAQDDIIVREKDSCYFRYGRNAKGEHIRLETKEQLRYVEWECGKELGVVDCNSELSYDEASNTVFKLNKDFTNVAGGNKPFNGTCESCHMNGRIQRRVTFLEGKENGTDTTFYESGCPQVIRALVKGVENGTWYYHYDSTEYIAWEMNYYMGQKHGKQIYFKKNGDTTKWENYQDGILHGWKRTYYHSGSLKREVHYNRGVFDGPFRVYNLERVVIEELNYKQGKKDQECNYYYDDGTLLKTESWDMGVKNGEFKTFYYQGHIQKTENYKKGKKEGWFEEFYPDQSAKTRKLYKKDELIEEHRYDEHGRETYSFGTPTGDANEDDEMPSTKKKKKKKKKKKNEE